MSLMFENETDHVSW